MTGSNGGLKWNYKSHFCVYFNLELMSPLKYNEMLESFKFINSWSHNDTPPLFSLSICVTLSRNTLSVVKRCTHQTHNQEKIEKALMCLTKSLNPYSPEQKLFRFSKQNFFFFGFLTLSIQDFLFNISRST